MRLLTTVDADEVSPVRSAANRRRLVLKGDQMGEEPEIADIMAVPWEHEGAMIDTLRKSGVEETVLKAAVGAMRLLNGVADEFPDEMRETVEKLGTELYAHTNPKLNSGNASDVPGSSGDLFGSADGDPKNTPGRGGGGDLDGEGRDGELSGTGAGKKVAATEDDMDDDGVMKDGKEPYGDVTYADPGYQSDKKKRYPLDTERHVRAAWSYINQGKNAAKYSAEQASAIKGRIRSAMKRIGANVEKSDEEIEQMLDALLIPEGWSLARFTKAMRRRSQDARPSTPDDPDGDTTEEPDDDPDDTTVNKGGTVEAHAVPVQKEDGTWDLSAVPDESRPFYESMIEKADRLEKAETELAETREQLRTTEIVAKAEEQFQLVGAQDDVVAVLKAASAALDPEVYGKLEELLATANERITKGDLFAEMGRSHGSGDAPKGDAWAKIEKAADELVEKAENGLSQSQAIDRVLQTREGKELYSQYLAENPLGVM